MPRFAALLLTIALLVTTTATAMAAPPPGGPTDPGELDAFVTEMITRQMADYHIPGAVFALVKDGEILLAKGFGIADVERSTPVEPDRTLFAIGSVTKLVTATAVMQLVEQGRLDLHADINQYLKEFQVPDTYPAPITMAHLLTHTAGFDERMIGIAARTEAEMEPLGQHLARELPRRVRPPGQVYQYSNHGMALAGYLVEVISGRSYDQYVQDEILQPLGMQRTTLAMPADLLPDMVPVNGYAGVKPVRQPDWYLHLGPAGDMKATATDMAAFMIAMLQRGEYQGQHILREETALEMQRQQFTPHPAMPGSAYGFMERFRNGHRAIEHGGSTLGTSSLLWLLPDQNWGFFVSYSSPLGGMSANELAEALIDRYAPGSVEPPVVQPGQDLSHFAGTYRMNRYERDSMAKAAGLLSVLQVADNRDGTLTVTIFGGARPPMIIAPVEPLIFRSVDGNGHVAFEADERGRIVRMHVPMGVTAADRLPWYEATLSHLGLVASVALLGLTAIIGWPVGALVRRIRRRPAPGGPVRVARWLAGAVSGLFLVFMVGISATLTWTMFGISTGMKLLLGMALVGSLLTLPLVWATVRVWMLPGWSLVGKVHLGLVSLVSVLFVPFLWYWNLLGFRF